MSLIHDFGYIKLGAVWPPVTDANRQRDIREHQNLYDNFMERVYPQIRVGDPGRVVRVNWFRRIAHFWQEALFSTPPILNVDIGDDYAPLMSASKEATLDLIRFGALVVVQRTRKSLEDVEYRPRWVNVSPANWQPICDPWDDTEIIGHIVAFPYMSDAANLFMADRLAIYLIDAKDPSATELKTFKYDNVTIGSQLSEERVADAFTVYSAGNHTNRLALYGNSDYEDIKDMVREISQQQAELGSVFTKHTDPNMYGDERVTLPDAGLNNSGDFFPVPEGGVKPGYMVWEAQLEYHLKRLEELRRDVLNMSALPDSIFATSGSGLAQSGTAYALRSFQMQLRVEELRRMWEGLWERMLSDSGRPCRHGRLRGHVAGSWTA